MKVLMMSRISKGNPYIGLLVRSLKATGVEVYFPLEGRVVLWKSVMTWRPDIVHLQWQHQFFGSSSLLNSVIRSMQFFSQLFALRLVGTRFVWTVHNILNHEKRFARWELAMCRVLAKSVDLLIVHCTAAAAEVSAAFKVSPDRIRVVPHGHFRDSYPPVIERLAARERFGIDPEARVALLFGRLQRYKGVAALLEAFSQVDSETIRLILAGQPKTAALAHELQAAASKDPRVRTEFGFIPDDVLIAYISACDLVVLPYKDTLTSGAAILAASCGKPILAPRLGCMRDFPPNGGVFFDPDFDGALEKALERLVDEPLEAMGGVAANYVLSSPWSLVSGLTLDVYREASEGRAWL